MLKRILQSMAGVKGRKSLILVSEGFIYDPNIDEFKDTLQASRRSNMAVYFLDTRGLGGLSAYFGAEFGPAIPEQDLAFAFSESFEASEGSESLASDSGGFTVRNTNDLSAGIQKIADDSRVYYLLGYNPTNTARDGRFRKIEVKSLQQRASRCARAAATTPRSTARRRSRTRRPATTPTSSSRSTRPTRKRRSRCGSPTTSSTRRCWARRPRWSPPTSTSAASPSRTWRAGGHQRAGVPADRGPSRDRRVLPLRPEDRTSRCCRRRRRGSTSRGSRSSASSSWRPAATRPKMVVRDQNSREVGSLIHEFEVPPLGEFRSSTPVLSDTRAPSAAAEGVPGGILTVLARREFASGSDLFCQFEVRPSPKGPTVVPGSQSPAATSRPARRAMRSLTRDGANAATEGLILFKVVGNKLEDLVASTAWRWNPDFVSLSNGDLNGDGDDEVVMLRDPSWATTSLLMVNPVGATLNPFEQATGYGNTAFRIVRTGDTDGDGKEEIVILRADRYRVYTEPNIDSRVLETTGAFYTPGSVSNLPFMAVANVDGGGQSAGPTLSVAPSSLSFNLDFGATSPVKPLSITNSGTGSNLAWQAQAIEDQVAQGGPWLLIDATSGATPGTVNVRVRTDISPNTYSGKIRITTTDPAVPNKTVDVPVTYTLAQGQGFVVSPGTLNFTVPWGSTGAQAVAIGAAGPTTWTAEVLSGSPWLTLGATSGAAPGSLNIFASSVAAGIGTWQGTVKITAGTPMPNSPQYITVDLRVPDPGFVVSPQDITIRQATSATPMIRYVTIFRPEATVSWSASALPLSEAAGLAEKFANGQVTITAEGVSSTAPRSRLQPGWCSRPPPGTTNPTTPSTMQISVQPGTPPGTYGAVITVVASGDPSLTNPVQLVYVTAIVANNFSFTSCRSYSVRAFKTSLVEPARWPPLSMCEGGGRFVQMTGGRYGQVRSAIDQSIGAAGIPRT